MTQARLIAAAVALALFALLAPWAAGDGAADEYKVANGETLSEIAERHGMTVEELAQANGIVNPDLILSGQVLVVPGAAGGRGAVPVHGGAGLSGSGGSYVVQAGDTLSDIADRFGVPLVALVQANGLSDPHLIVEGEALVIPVPEIPIGPPAAPETEAILDEAAAAEGLDHGLVKALAYLESGWQQDAVSHTGAMGVMQIQPTTGYWLESEIFGYELNIETSAYDNIRAGVRYLSILMDLTGDTDKALAAYYQGYGALSLGIIYEDTIEYVAAVKAVRDMYWP
ncbi:MAG TPA: LysM peptidoglycan-binding domain-containing protein [Dehalococcoidia bacterium]|nr:LysM peptidoglycan-binding domain-containing protein [Dehalococcoidia bacterium]